jgi:transposase
MPRRRTMTEYREIVRRLQKSQSIRGIQRETGIHRTIIRKIKKHADKNGWSIPGTPLPSEESLYDICGKSAIHNCHPLDSWQEKIKEWLDEDYSYVVIHKLIQPSHNCSEATVRRYIKKHFPGQKKAVTCRETVAGETMEVDFGYMGITYDSETNRRRKTYLFSGRLNHSRDAYREIIFDQKQQTFFNCHVHAFEYFGGVPKKVVPDNLKAAVLRASYESPVVNRVYRALAEHYNFMISPTLPRKPEHKGGVENDIKYVKNNFLPIFKEGQKNKGYADPHAQEMIKALDVWNRETARVRMIGGVGRSPKEIFENEEQHELQPLPRSRWNPIIWSEGIKVQDTCRIQYNCAFFSVPYKYIGKKVDVLADSTTVYIFLSHKQIAIHPREKHKWEFVKNKDHFPPHAQQYMSITRESLKRVAVRIGEYTGKIVTHILDNKQVDGLRPARAIVFSLKKKYGSFRLEAACKRAWIYDTPEYYSVKSILIKELDKTEIKQPVDSKGQHLFHFARAKGYFDPANHTQTEGGTPWMN